MKTRTPAARRTAIVAVVGNPNAGKTTIFNRLTGLSQRVGNYPGVTVERKRGRSLIAGREVAFIDLPGTYSLAARSPDEMVAVDVLLGHLEGEERPQLVLQVVDASNLERNLYLLSQVLELGLEVVVALNMTDVAAARGIQVDASLLSRRLGVPVIPLVGHRGIGIPELKEEVGRRLLSVAARNGTPPPPGPCLLDGALTGLDQLREELDAAFARERGRPLHRVELLRALIDQGGYAEERLSRSLGGRAQDRLLAARSAMKPALPLPALEAKLRYAWARELLRGCLRRERKPGISRSERIDRVLTHKALGLLIFAAAMLLVFQSIFVWARPLMLAVEAVFASAGSLASTLIPEGVLRSLVVDGIISGVGMVVVFLPQIVILFFFIGLLEDCGYMARAAFLMDRLMDRCGLSGKSFIPMLSGFACAVPGVMAARVIEDRRDRLATILVTPLMSCSARLPVYSIFIGAFIPDRALVPGLLGLRGLTLFGLYALGMATAVGVAFALRKTLLRGGKAPFVLELPSYKWPSPRGVLLRLRDRARAFLVRAGTTILAIAVVVWALAYFPRPAEVTRRYAAERAAIESATVNTTGNFAGKIAGNTAGNIAGGAAESSAAERAAALESLRRAEAGEHLRSSYFARIGRAVEPAFRPLGWDWRISMAAIASFPAREVIVATLGTIYNLGQDVGSESAALRENLRAATWPAPDGRSAGPPLFTIPVALSIMVFFALCCQCGATVATIKRETNSWGWAGFAFGYMTVLAYLGALVTYQVGSAI